MLLRCEVDPVEAESTNSVVAVLAARLLADTADVGAVPSVDSPEYLGRSLSQDPCDESDVLCDSEDRLPLGI